MTVRKQPARRDPERRHHDVTAPVNHLVNRDERMHYVYVHKACEERGPEYYEALGYEIVRKTKDGPRPKMGARKIADGSNIELRGHVLMEISREKLAEIERVGPDGSTGQELYDRLENKVSKTEGLLPDGLRGRSGSSVRVVNETTSAAPE